MSWFFPFSDGWKKRACRYLLQRYLGQFLEEKLTLDQLSVDLYNGTGSVSDVCLDVQGLNELAEQHSLPLEFVDGYIGEMSVSIPWATILRDSSYVQISGMVLTVQPKQRAEEMGAGSLFESMISMTSSIQLATEIQQTEPPDPGDQVDSNQKTNDQAIEGIELIARTLDSILCKIKVKFVDTTVRIEHLPKGSKTGVALEIRVKNMDYCDEAGCDFNNEDSSSSSPSSESAFAIKKFHLDGVSLFTDEFLSSDRTVSRPLMSSTVNSSNTSLETKYQDLNIAEDNITPTKESADDKKPFGPILFGKLAGRQELRVKVKQSDNIPGPKVDVEVNMGSLMIFSTPRQIHLLQELFHGLATPGIQDSSNVVTKEKRMDKADFEKVGLDLLHQLHPAANEKDHKGLQNMPGWSSADPDEDSDDEFHPIGGALSRGCSLASSMDSSTMSSVSGLSKSASIDLSCPTSRSNYLRQGKRKKHRASTSDPESGSDRNHYQIRLSSLAIVLVHEDILTVSVDTGFLVPSSVQQLHKISTEFFNKLALFAISPHGNKDFQNSKQVFLNACHLNHLRLLAAPVILELDEKNSGLSGLLSGGSVELLECLVEENKVERNESTFDGNLNDAASTKAQYVELLRFMRTDDEKTDPAPKNPITHQPDVKIKIKHCKNNRSASNSTELILQLEQCWSEIDISIMDRISSLLNAKPLCSRPSHSKLDGNTMQSCFDQAIETCVEYDTKLEWKISSAYLVIKLRFPIPDLRPVHDMNRPPWWKYRVHDDILFLQLTDISARSHMTSHQPAQSVEIQCRSAKALFQEANTNVAIPFACTTFEDESLLSNDFGQDIGWPRLVLRIYSGLNYDIDLEDPMEEPVCMAQSIIEPQIKEASPFTYRKIVHDSSDLPHSKSTNHVQYEGEELIIPGDKEEISNFIEDACRKAHIQVDIQLPTAYVQFPNKHLYELIYNRFTSDLLLWTPSAPSSQSSNVNMNYNNVFTMCKGQQDSDFESEEEEEGGVYYSMHEHRQRNQRMVPQEPYPGQSAVTISLSVAQCVLDLYTIYKDETGVAIDDEFGEIVMSCEDVHLFTVSKYKGKPTNSFVIVQVNNASLDHSNKVQNKRDIFNNCKFPTNCDHLLETIYKSEESCIASNSYQPVGCGADSLDVLTVVVHTYIDDRQLKMNRVSCCLRGSTLRHRMNLPYQSIYAQLMDFFDVIDYPIIGYEPLPIIVEYHQHFIDCAIDYRPLHLPYSAIVSLGSFSISCNLAARTTSSTLRFIAEDISLFISNKTIEHIVDLKQDYVCVIELGLFELSVRVSENKNQPHLDLKASNNIINIRTCSDSARALLVLLSYFATDGDLKDTNKDLSQSDNQSIASSTSSLPILEDTSDDPQRINELMEEAMTETVTTRSRTKSNSLSEQVEVFLFPDEGTVNVDEELLLEDDEYLDKEFCFLEPEAGSGCIFQTKEPEVHVLTTTPIKLYDNHFAMPLGKTDLLQPPKHFPIPVQRYTLRETTIVWHIYGGSDFCEDLSSCPSSPAFKFKRNNSIDSTVSFNNSRVSGVKEVTFNTRRESTESLNSYKSSPKQSCNNSLPIRWQEKGGPGRQHDVKMQLQLSKLRFQHDVYPEKSPQASRQVILIHDVEIRDRLASSNINKFLYAYASKKRPRQSHAHMVMIKALHLRNDRGEEESCIKVSLLPLRLNIDQDTVMFLFSFATELSGISEDKENLPDPSSPVATSKIMVDTSSMSSSSPKYKEEKKSPIFIKSFVFSPEVLIRLDYQGKHVDMTHGPLAGILMGLAHLSCSEITLKRINHRYGLLGFNKLIAFMQQEWSQDIYKNQLPSLLGGVGPMYSLVQLAQGIKDLFWLPIEQYQKDGRIVRGLQRGANSFTTSTAMAALELTARIVLAIQTVAETAFDMVSPGPSIKRQRNNSSKKLQRYTQPIDFREGVTSAYTIVREGMGETAHNFFQVAHDEHEAKGTIGAVGGVLRQIPSTAIKPIILASKATSNILDGVKSQLVPDARKEAAHKWRTDDL